MLDFNLHLPENVGLRDLAIVPEFDNVHPLIQRAVCLLVTHEDPGLGVNGVPVLDLVQTAVTKNTPMLAQLLTAPADRLKYLLNYDKKTTSSVEFFVKTESGRLVVDINITPIDEVESVSSTIFSA